MTEIDKRLRMPNPADLREIPDELEVYLREMCKRLARFSKLSDQMNTDHYAERYVESVRWHGATGDGVTDDTDAVQAAIDIGGTILFPPGTYLVSGVSIGASNVSLIGEPGAILKLKASSTSPIVTANGYDNIIISDLAFDANNANQSDSDVPQTRQALKLWNGDYFHVHRCKFDNPVENAVDFYTANYCCVDDCLFTGQVVSSPAESAVCDIHATTCSFVNVRNCVMNHGAPSDATDGIVSVFYSGVTYGWIDNNVVRYCGRDAGGGHQGGAIDLYNNNSGIRVTNNLIDYHCYMGIRVRGDNLRIIGNRITPYTTLTGSDCNGIEVSSSTDGWKDIWICENDIECEDAVGGDGIYCVSGDGATYTDSENFHINNNTIRKCSRGIYVYRSCIGLEIRGNHIHDLMNQAIIVTQVSNMEISRVVVANNVAEMTGANNVQAFALNVTKDLICVGNMAKSAYQGIGLWVPSGGIVMGNVIDSSHYAYLYYDETQDIFSYDNQQLGSGGAEYREGSEVVYTRNPTKNEYRTNFGSSGSQRGAGYFHNGAGGNTPGFIVLESPNGTLHYLFAEDDGTIKQHNAVPTQNSDGNVVGAQT